MATCTVRAPGPGPYVQAMCMQCDAHDMARDPAHKTTHNAACDCNARVHAHRVALAYAAANAFPLPTRPRT